MWELDDLPHTEYVGWYAWLGRRQQQLELAQKARR